MKILFLSSWYPNRANTHLGNFVQKHAEAVALQSEVAALFVCSDMNCNMKYEIEQSVINNVLTVNIYYKKVTHKIPLLSQSQRAWRYLNAHFIGWRKIKEKLGRIDLIHHNILYPAGVFALVLKWMYGYKYIVTEHSTEYLPTASVRFNIFRKIGSYVIARNASFITVVAENLKKAMLQKGLKAKYEIVNNVVDTNLFVPRIINKSKFRLLHISTLNDRQKNVSGMLRAIASLARQRNDFECLFVGEGRQEVYIDLSKELGIYDSVVNFEGVKSTEEIATIMGSADCFIMFSNYENLPVVIPEALACGVPVISSNVGGISEHVNDENGLLVPARDEDSLLKALGKMLDNIKAKKYNGNTLRNYAVKNFSYEEVSRKFHTIYAEVLKNV